ncbi:hypothetical protein VTK26DRAFT_3036 [Humicola hyalothermophila]
MRLCFQAHRGLVFGHWSLNERRPRPCPLRRLRPSYAGCASFLRVSQHQPHRGHILAPKTAKLFFATRKGNIISDLSFASVAGGIESGSVSGRSVRLTLPRRLEVDAAVPHGSATQENKALAVAERNLVRPDANQGISFVKRSKQAQPNVTSATISQTASLFDLPRARKIPTCRPRCSVIMVPREILLGS